LTFEPFSTLDLGAVCHIFRSLKGLLSSVKFRKRAERKMRKVWIVWIFFRPRKEKISKFLEND